jgi:hypothetical protein
MDHSASAEVVWVPWSPQEMLSSFVVVAPILTGWFRGHALERDRTSANSTVKMSKFISGLSFVGGSGRRAYFAVVVPWSGPKKGISLLPTQQSKSWSSFLGRGGRSFLEPAKTRLTSSQEAGFYMRVKPPQGVYIAGACQQQVLLYPQHKWFNKLKQYIRTGIQVTSPLWVQF